MALKFGLYVTATPIGNLSDITLRALQVLKGADLILCEDTRVTGKLLSGHGIKVRLLAYHDHNADRLRPQIIKRIKGGEALALVSDAGTPLISDPGYKLVKELKGLGLPVYPIPGASAPMAALMAAGLPTDKFYFAGFLPAKAGARSKALEALADIKATLVFFESPKRVTKTVAAMRDVFGPEREAALCRELTKMFEEVLRLPLGELSENLEARTAIKGEIVLVVAPPDQARGGHGNFDAALKVALKKLSVKDAAALVSALTGKSKNDLYARALEIQGKT